MRRADYKCECGFEVEKVFDYTPPAEITSECPDSRCAAIMKRKWGSVHTGRGSSGEPPR